MCTHQVTLRPSALVLFGVAVSLILSAADPAFSQPKELAKFHEKNFPINELAFSCDCTRLVTFTRSAEVKVFDLKARKCVQTLSFDSPGGDAYGGFLPTGELLVAASTRSLTTASWKVLKCNVQTGATELVKASAGSEIAYPLWPEKNMVVTQTYPGLFLNANPVSFIDLAGKKATTVVRWEVPFRIVTYSPDRTLVVLEAGKHANVRIVEIVTGKVVAAFPIHATNSKSCLLTTDNKTLITVPDDYEECRWIYLWDVASGKQRSRLEARMAVESLGDVSPDGRLLTMSWAKRIQLFDLKKGEFVETYTDADGDFLCLRFAPDSKTFATGERNGVVRIFETPQLK